METIKDIVVFISQFFVVLMPLLAMALFILLIKFLTYKPNNDLVLNDSPKDIFNNNDLNLYDYSVERLEECIETKKKMTNKSIHEELEEIKEEIQELEEEKETIEKEIVLPEPTKEPVDEFIEIEKVIVDADKHDELMNLIEEKFSKFIWKLKNVKTPKDLEKFNYEYEKFKKYKKHAKKKFEEFEKKIIKKTNEIKKKYPKYFAKEQQAVNNKEEKQPVVQTVQNKKEETIKQDEKPEPVKEEIPVIENKQTPISKKDKLNNEQKLERLKKINTELKAKEKRVVVLTASLFSAITITNVINKKKKEKQIKKQPEKAIKPKRVEIKTSTETPITKKKIRLIYNKEKTPKGNLQVFIKPKKKPILTRISSFVNKLVILPITSIIRMERVQKLDKERTRRELIQTEMQQLKTMKAKLSSVNIKKHEKERKAKLKIQKEKLQLDQEKPKVLKKRQVKQKKEKSSNWM